MAYQSRTWVATLSFATLLTTAIGACGYLPLQVIPLMDDGGGVVDEGDGRSVADGPGGADASVIDAGCTGPSCPGTYVSGTTGNDANPGTGAAPVKTIKRGIEIAVIAAKLGGGGGAENVYVAAAQYLEKIRLAEGVSLLGGYACDAKLCPWTRDVPPFTTLDTVILDTDSEGVQAPHDVTRTTLLEGFRIMGQPQPTLVTSAAVTIDEGTPTIRHCRIVAGAATTSNAGITIGVAILAPSNDPQGSLLDQNRIVAGAAANESIGVLIDAKANAPINKPAVAVLTGNFIQSGSAPFTSGVVARASGPGTLLRGNDIVAGSSTLRGAWGISVETEMTIDANRINLDQAKVGDCLLVPLSYGQFCGGIQSVSSTTIITNNVVLGMKGKKSCAVLLVQEGKLAGPVILNANTLDGASELTANGVSTAIALRRGDGSGGQANIGSVRNNLLIGGMSYYRFGVYEEDGPSSKTVHLAALDHNDFWDRAAGGAPAAYRFVDGSGPTSLTFAQLPTFPPTPNANLNDDPMLDASFHIAKTSPVVGKGTSTEVPAYDIDGKPRPKGAIDMGAYQAK